MVSPSCSSTILAPPLHFFFLAMVLILVMEIDGEKVAEFIFWAPKSLQMVIAAMELKDTYSLEGNLLPT